MTYVCDLVSLLASSYVRMDVGSYILYASIDLKPFMYDRYPGVVEP